MIFVGVKAIFHTFPDQQVRNRKHLTGSTDARFASEVQCKILARAFWKYKRIDVYLCHNISQQHNNQ